jgi:arginine decarboxylase
MRIRLAAAVGRGPTELAAFDAALVAAGVADRNLIRLSSVLPPGSRVDRCGRIEEVPGDWGDRLYCVMARGRATEPGTQAWAGIGWVQDECGRGLLVEHHADDEPGLRRLVRASLDGLCANRGVSFPHRDLAVAGAWCHGNPVCSLVIAVYEAASWGRCQSRYATSEEASPV